MEHEKEVRFKEFNDLVKSLDNDSKATRRVALKNIQKFIDCQSEFELRYLDILLGPLTQIISRDDVDSIREHSSSILLKLTNNCSLNNDQFAVVVNLCVDRGCQEKCEEIRLNLAKLLYQAINQQSDQEQFIKFLDELTKILKEFLSDRYSEVIKEACDIILRLSDVNRQFRLQADFMVKPLLQNLKTQPMKVRVACARALQPVVSKAPLTIPEIVPQLEKSWAECGPQLQLAVVRTIGQAALEVESDDQNFHLLIPVILLGTCNDFAEVNEEAEMYWQRIKNQLDEPGDFHISANSARNSVVSNFLCFPTGEFLNKCFTKLLPDILKGAEDWDDAIRSQTAQLLFRFLQQVPDKTSSLSTVMEILVFQEGDQVPVIRLWVTETK